MHTHSITDTVVRSWRIQHKSNFCASVNWVYVFRSVCDILLLSHFFFFCVQLMNGGMKNAGIGCILHIYCQLYVCMYVYIYIYIHIHTYTHTHMHAHKGVQLKFETLTHWNPTGSGVTSPLPCYLPSVFFCHHNVITVSFPQGKIQCAFQKSYFFIHVFKIMLVWNMEL